MEGELETTPKLSNGTSLDDLNRSSFSVPNYMAIFRRGPPKWGKNQNFQPIRRFGNDVFLFPFDWHLVYGFALTY